MLMTNCIDIFSLGRFLNAYLNTLREVFPHVAVFHDPGYAEDSRSTFVLAASPLEIPDRVLRSPGGEAVGYRLSEAQLEELRGRDGPMVLTDAYAPVESLIAPVFLRSVD